MRKITSLLIALTVCAGAITAKPVGVNAAQTVAKNFYSQNSNIPVSRVNLVYTEFNSAGTALYYIFNINSKDGFVMVAADDAASPILGYSTKGNYSTGNVAPNFAYWVTKYKKQIINIQQKALSATAEIKREWTDYTVNNKHPHKLMTAVTPLCQSTWDQPSPYNIYCPGGSVTGCVATAMAQIMRYWSYPAIGKGSWSYCDCTSGGFSQNYGTLSANYAHPYRWANMPLNGPTTSDTDMARLLSDCGISVNMDYSPSGSGAWVIKADDSICAQTSYVKYFGYDSVTINGYNRTSFADSVWLPMIENEMNNNRLVQYAGFGPAGGHTWVCDGYDASSNFHMNWGWSGADDGYFNLNNLNPGGDTFDSGEQAIVGIEPPIVIARFTASTQMGCAGTVVNFTDKSMSPTTITSWKWSFAGGTPSTSTAQNPVITYNTAGTYAVTESVTSSTGSDSVVQTSYINIEAPGPLPLAQDFESGTFPPLNWSIFNPNNDAHTWMAYSGVGGYGKSSNCMYYNNCAFGVTGERDNMHTPLYDFTGNSNPFIYFDVAYAPYDTVQYSDTLAVYSSIDCGNTWNLVYLKGGWKLGTAGNTVASGKVNKNTNGCFVPLATNWRTDSIILTSLANQPSVMFSFENRSGYGSNMYVDNINVPSTALGVINHVAPAPSVTLYPNPNNGAFTLEIANGYQLMANSYTLTIYNVLGQSIYSKVLTSASTTVNLQQAAGIYFYRVLSLNGKTLSEGKLIVK